MKYFYIYLFLFINISLFSAQDIHFSQPTTSPLQINPAWGGLFGGDVRLTANYHSQWQAVPVPYRTINISAETHLLAKKLKNDVFGVGLALFHDKAGDSELTHLKTTVSLNYAKRIDKLNFISIGAQTGWGQRSLNTKKLYFDRQFNGDIFDPNSSTGESFVGLQTSYIDVSTGINWLFQKDMRNKSNIGIAAYHLNTPSISFFENGDIKLPLRLSAIWSSSFRLNSVTDILPLAMYQKQNTYQEVYAGAAFRYWLNQKKGVESAFHIGSYYRLNDAIVAMFGVQYSVWEARLSYDINTSAFKKATNGRGGVEVSLIYINGKPQKPRDIRRCPVL